MVGHIDLIHTIVNIYVNVKYSMGITLTVPVCNAIGLLSSNKAVWKQLSVKIIYGTRSMRWQCGTIIERKCSVYIVINRATFIYISFEVDCLVYNIYYYVVSC